MPQREVPLPRHEVRGETHRGQADAELAAILPEVTGPSGQFRHRQHIHLAFLAVRRYGMPEATTRICEWIQRIAAYERAPQKYHHTVSRAWVEIVAHHVDADPDCADFGIFAARHPALLDKRLLTRHYRSSTLAAAPARRDWVEPDLLPFPWSPAQDSSPSTSPALARSRKSTPRSSGCIAAAGSGLTVMSIATDPVDAFAARGSSHPGLSFRRPLAIRAGRPGRPRRRRRGRR